MTPRLKSWLINAVIITVAILSFYMMAAGAIDAVAGPPYLIAFQPK
ncbi:hypothetical protein V8J88_03960 [Massilia sp. W12]